MKVRNCLYSHHQDLFFKATYCASLSGNIPLGWGKLKDDTPFPVLVM